MTLLVLRRISATAESGMTVVGITMPVGYRIEGVQAILPLDLGRGRGGVRCLPHARDCRGAHRRTVALAMLTEVARVDGPWTVVFQPDRGALASIRLDALAPLDMNADQRVRYFARVATCQATMTIPARAATVSLVLDLRGIGDVAQMRVNGKLVGTAQHALSWLDLGGAAHTGRIRIEVRVANLWVNRLIDDAQPGWREIT